MRTVLVMADKTSTTRTILRWFAVLLLAVVIAALLAWRIKDPERRTMDASARVGIPGAFIRLRNGTTHYEIAGPDTGTLVVLAAAFSVPAWLSDSLYQGLADSGFRVLRFDYFGRGWSDRLDTTYNQELF